jgi:hypothetical protein
VVDFSRRVSPEKLVFALLPAFEPPFALPSEKLGNEKSEPQPVTKYCCTMLKIELALQ